MTGLVMAVAMFQRYGDHDYTGRVMSFTDVQSNQITGVVEVTRPEGRATTCIVRARAADGDEVGRAEMPVPVGGGRTVTVRYTLATSRPPVTFELANCVPA